MALTAEEAKALIKALAEQERAAKKKKELKWQPPTRKELEKRRGKLRR